MRPQHFFAFAIAIVACALFSAQAGAAESSPQAVPSLILADAESADNAPLSAQDFTGGVGQSGSDANPMVIQMAQPSAGSAPSNSPSNYSYVRVPAGH